MVEEHSYRGNVNLKSANTPTQYTKSDIQEFAKSVNNPIYFINNYCKIVHIDTGIVPFKLYPYQEKIIKHFHGIDDEGITHPDWRFSLTLTGRQMGKTSVSAAYILWYCIANEAKTSFILGNKAALAREILDRIKLMYELLPTWLKPGVVEWNKGRVKFDNGCQIIAGATSASACRGYSVSLLYLDELSFVQRNVIEEFWNSTYPTISSGKESRVIISTTPNGLDFFYKLWVDSLEGRSEFRNLKFTWQDHPHRDQEWYETQIKNLGDDAFMQEFNAEFLGSSYTLIDGRKLATIPFINSIFNKDNLEIFCQPEKDRSYAITVDVSRGRHMDYSAFSVIDVTQMPYKVVAIYKDNSISPLEFPHLIYNVARQYNKAFILIEINDLGEQVSNIIWNDYEYENMYFTKGNELSTIRGYPGIRTTAKVKSIGCSILKELIEHDQLIVNSHKIVEELGGFVLHKKSYAAQDKVVNDDLCTTLWLFAWLTVQDIFQDITNNNLRKILTEQKQTYIDETMTPFGFFSGEVEKLSSIKLPDKDNPLYLTEDQRELLNF